jgi:hypothetical protein
MDKGKIFVPDVSKFKDYSVGIELNIDSITDLRKELDQLKEWLSYGKYSAK